MVQCSAVTILIKSKQKQIVLAMASLTYLVRMSLHKDGKMKVHHLMAETGRVCQRVDCKMPMHKKSEMTVQYWVAETGSVCHRVVVRCPCTMKVR